MTRITVIIIGILAFGLNSKLQSQIITGQVIDKATNESLAGVKIFIDSTYVISDFDGNFSTKDLKKHPNSITFEATYEIKLKIINLPKNYDTLKLDKVELINHTFISKSQYDSIRTCLIATFDNKDLLIIQQKKADSLLKSKYSAIYCWSDLLGYDVLDSISNKEITNPFDNKSKVILDFDPSMDLITLDYEKIKK